jgi:uncharacterized protein (DUF1330 family)
MPAYAVAHLRELNVNREVVVYLKRIDATLEPYEGQFLVHGRQSEVVEGTFPGYCIIITFPDIENARSWYHSEAYQDIVALRTENSDSSVILIDGVPDDYRAADLLKN